MARGVSREALEAAILEELAGGEVTHDELLTRLEARGLAAAGQMLIGLANRKVIAPTVKRDAEGERATLRYSLPPAQASGVSSPAGAQSARNKGGVR